MDATASPRDAGRPADAKPARLPAWARKGSPLAPGAHAMRVLLREGALNTVCEEARCPNLGECFSRGTATFMLLGDRCTRRCGYCSVGTAKPLPPDRDEPERVARAAFRLGLRYVVLTSVNRDDLADGGAAHFAATIEAVRASASGGGDRGADARLQGRPAARSPRCWRAVPTVFNHNIETVPRLFQRLRPQGRYRLSLETLAAARAIRPGVPTKSGLMLGLGETDAEVLEVLADLRASGVSIVTLGQYLRPTRDHEPVHRYVPPEVFSRLEQDARRLGFEAVYAGVFVRSSYNADEVFHARGAR